VSKNNTPKADAAPADANAINVDAIRAKVIADAHPAANIFPMMGNDEFANLCLSLKQNGFDAAKPIKRDNAGKITDGRNREAAVQVVNAELAQWNTANPNDAKPLIQAVYAASATNDADLLAGIMADNFARRHLTPSQKAAVLVKAGILSSAYAKKDELGAQGEKLKGDIAELVAKQHGVNHDYIYKAKTILKTPKVGRALLEQIAAGELSVMAAYAEIKKLEDGEPAEGAANADAPDAVLDGMKKPVPAEFAEVFKVRAKFAAVGKLFRDARKLMDEIAAADGGNLLAEGNNLKEAKRGISDAAKSLRNCEPHVVCPHCDGTGKHTEDEKKLCPVCGGLGFLTEPQHDAFIKHGAVEPTEGEAEGEKAAEKPKADKPAKGEGKKADAKAEGKNDKAKKPAKGEKGKKAEDAPAAPAEGEGEAAGEPEVV